MAKNDRKIWIGVPEEMHGKVIEFAGREHRTVQGQYRHFFELGMNWAEKITAELSQQRAFMVESITGKKKLLRATESNGWDGRERRKEKTA